MTYEHFIQAVYDKVQEHLPAGTTIQLQKIYKNNGLVMDGLTISASHSNISPTIFLNSYYDKRETFPNLDVICEDILRTYEHNRTVDSVNIEFFTDYEKVKDRLAYRIINYDKNKELLKTVPHVRYLDLAIVFYCLLNISDVGNATILVHNEHLKLWRITTQQLHSQTNLSTPRLLPFDFRSMTSFLQEIFKEGSQSGESADTAPSSFCPMYVLTNAHKLYGASCMLYPNLLSDISRHLNQDLFLLPCSVHELIILPTDSRRQTEELQDMVADINTTELSMDEVLSDNIYYYSRREEALCIAR